MTEKQTIWPYTSILCALSLLACAVESAPLSLKNKQEQPAPIDDGNSIASYAAQCEAVLGKIPEISCDPDNPAPGTQVTKIPVFLDGLLLGFDENLSEEESALLAERREQGRYTCDFPSIGGDFSCTIGSTLVHYQSPDNPNVQWVGLCRGIGRDNPGYDRFIGNGLIGANTKTGEMCFFFGANPDPEAPYQLPRLTSEDKANEELAPWLPPSRMPGSCISCHPNNDPWILTPWLMPEYMRSVISSPQYPLRLPDGVALDEVFAARFIRTTPASLQTMLPTPLPRGRTAWTEEEIIDASGQVTNRQYRLVGSSYVNAEAQGLVQPRTGLKPESWNINFRDRIRLQPQEKSCSRGCHAIGNEHWAVLAADSLGNKFAEPYLSDFMQHGAMAGFQWMDPLLQAKPEEVRFSEFTVSAITECPIPKRMQAPSAVNVRCEPIAGYDGAIEIEWQYINDFGDVPGRDDVRFDVGYGSPSSGAWQSGVSAQSEREGVYMEDRGPEFTVIRDVAPMSEGSWYRVTVPFFASQGTVTMNLQPKRFCFEEPDRNVFAYAPPYQVEVDVAAECASN